MANDDGDNDDNSDDDDDDIGDGDRGMMMLMIMSTHNDFILIEQASVFRTHPWARSSPNCLCLVRPAFPLIGTYFQTLCWMYCSKIQFRYVMMMIIMMIMMMIIMMIMMVIIMMIMVMFMVMNYNDISDDGYDDDDNDLCIIFTVTSCTCLPTNCA